MKSIKMCLVVMFIKPLVERKEKVIMKHRNNRSISVAALVVALLVLPFTRASAAEGDIRALRAAPSLAIEFNNGDTIDLVHSALTATLPIENSPGSDEVKRAIFSLRSGGQPAGTLSVNDGALGSSDLESFVEHHERPLAFGPSADKLEPPVRINATIAGGLPAVLFVEPAPVNPPGPPLLHVIFRANKASFAITILGSMLGRAEALSVLNSISFNGRSGFRAWPQAELRAFPKTPIVYAGSTSCCGLYDPDNRYSCGPGGNCVWLASYARQDIEDSMNQAGVSWHNANQWPANAKAAGFPVDTTFKESGDIVAMPTLSDAGHVFPGTGVSSGYVNGSQMDYYAANCVTQAHYKVGTYGMQFIHRKGDPFATGVSWNQMQGVPNLWLTSFATCDSSTEGGYINLIVPTDGRILAKRRNVTNGYSDPYSPSGSAWDDISIPSRHATAIGACPAFGAYAMVATTAEEPNSVWVRIRLPWAKWADSVWAKVFTASQPLAPGLPCATLGGQLAVAVNLKSSTGALTPTLLYATNSSNTTFTATTIPGAPSTSVPLALAVDPTLGQLVIGILDSASKEPRLSHFAFGSLPTSFARPSPVRTGAGLTLAFDARAAKMRLALLIPAATPDNTMEVTSFSTLVTDQLAPWLRLPGTTTATPAIAAGEASSYGTSYVIHRGQAGNSLYDDLIPLP